MQISLHKNEYTDENFKVWDSLYGQSFSLYDLVLDFLNNPIDEYIDSLYFENNHLFRDFIKISDKSLNNDEYKIARLRELINNYIKKHSVEELKDFKEAITKLVDENFSKGELVTPHSFESSIGFRIELHNGILRELFETDDIEGYCLLVLSKLIEVDTKLKRCENCGTFFLPENGLEKYCNNIFQDDKTCKEIGSLNKVKSDKYLNQFGIIYRRTTFYKKTDFEIVDEVDFWRKYASLMRRKFKKGLIDGETLIDLVENSQQALLEVKTREAGLGWVYEWIKLYGQITKKEYNQLVVENKGGKG